MKFTVGLSLAFCLIYSAMFIALQSSANLRFQIEPQSGVLYKLDRRTGEMWLISIDEAVPVKLNPNALKTPVATHSK